jgi:hypothetical protein
MLLEKGADLTAQDKDGKTPLHFASEGKCGSHSDASREGRRSDSTGQGRQDTIALCVGGKCGSHSDASREGRRSDSTGQGRPDTIALCVAEGKCGSHSDASREGRRSDSTGQGRPDTIALCVSGEMWKPFGCFSRRRSDSTGQGRPDTIALCVGVGKCGSHSDASREGRRSDSTGQGRPDTIALCIGEGNVEAIQMLLEKGADPTAQDKDGKTPLHFASERGNVEAIRMLLEKGADLTAQDKDGKTPLHFASQRGNVEAIRMLLEKGADPTAQDKDGKTPLHFASEWGNVEVHSDASRAGRRSDSTGQDGKTPLHFALQREMWKPFGCFSRRAQIRQHRTKTARHHCTLRASRSGNVEAIRMLLEKGADLTAQDTGHRSDITGLRTAGHIPKHISRRVSSYCSVLVTINMKVQDKHCALASHICKLYVVPTFLDKACLIDPLVPPSRTKFLKSTTTLQRMTKQNKCDRRRMYTRCSPAGGGGSIADATRSSCGSSSQVRFDTIELTSTPPRREPPGWRKRPTSGQRRSVRFIFGFRGASSPE